MQKVLNGNHLVNADSLNNSIYPSAVLGWSMIGDIFIGTYEEIISSGHLRLIRNSNLRLEIIQYYSAWEAVLFRTAKRQSNYPNLIYQIFDDGRPTDNIDWFFESINRGGAETEFLREFRHEKNYAIFVRDENLV
jgi:hypothetical protein